MAVKYNKELTKNGAAIGSIISIVRPDDYTSSNTESTEASNWQISRDYPGWIECDGRTLNVSEYRALYAVIGNTYGGTAGSTFKLPDFRSKKICGTGAVDGTNGASLTLTPTKNASGGTGGSGGADEAGATGGIYTLSTIRQLPEDSETTPITPSNPASIGGGAIDTFSLGTFRSQGFSSTVFTAEPVLSGTVTFGVGPIREIAVAGVPPHTHTTEAIRRGSGSATQADPGPPLNQSANFFDESQGSVISFNRRRRPFPTGSVPAGIGDYFFSANVTEISITTNGTSLVPWGSGSGETGGFASPGGGGYGNQYLAFGRYPSSFPLATTRSASFTVNATNADTFRIVSIAGNDSNGGERVNTNGEDLRIAFNGVDQGIIMYSRGTPGSPADYDGTYQAWKENNYPISAPYRVSNLTVTLTQNVVSWEGEQGEPGGPDAYDMFGIAGIRVTGGNGGTYEYDPGDDPIPLQRHSHAIFWGTPNAGDSVPSSISSYGTGGGWNGVFGGAAGVGLRTGGNASVAFPSNSSIGPEITKTISVVDDVGNTVNPAIITLSDSSRTQFDNALNVRMQAAEEITLLTPYFRTKYIIKAY